MKVDFLTRFQGRTSTMNKREGVTGIIKANSNPIEKAPQHLSFSSYLARAAEINLQDKRPSNSHEVTPTNYDPQIYTNIDSFKTRKLSNASPTKPGTQMSKSHFAQSSLLKPPLSKTSTVNMNVNLSEYEFVAIPKRLLQYGLTLDEGQKIQQTNTPSRQIYHKSQSVDMPSQQNILIKSEIFQNGSYVRQNERKRSFVLAAINSMKKQG